MSDGKIVIETGLDTAGIEKGISKISSLASTGLKTAAAAIGGVSTALMGAGGYAVKVGSDFESAMSKVEAISGATVSQMEALTKKAKEMGASTKFSATESAEAFQYMAMAGWDSAQMIDGIGGIMNLAAADGLDLATTSDIVTDALTAFGLAASDSTHFADVLATASSNANTNVSMLGESFKYVAPVAGAMKYSVEDVSKALGLMANASVKGSMAGTSLKTALSNLAAPTDKMQEAMDKYGISLTDSKGKMKSLDEVMLNLRESLGGLSEDEQTAAASTLFGKEAMAGMLAIVNASEKDYTKLSEAIANADETAQKMADTMNDNLQGKLTLAKSALEGLGIQFYETVQDDMKNAVEEGTGYIDQLSQAFTNGGLEAAVDEAGDIVADLATKIAQSAPSMVNASANLIQAFIKGLIKNRKQLKAASQDIVDAVCDGLIKLLPKKMQEPAKKALDSLERTFKSGTKNILNISKSTLELLGKLFGKLADNMDTVLPVVVSLTTGFKAFKTVSGPVDTVVSVFQKLRSVSSETGLAMSALNAVMNANPAVLIAGGISLLVAALASHIITAGRADEAQDAFNRRMDELGASIEKTRNDLDGLKESMSNTSTSIEASTAPIEKLREKLGEAFDSTGKVKDGCEDMADYILSELNSAMGTEYSLTADGFIQNNEGVKQSLDEVNKSIDEYVCSLKRKSLSEATSNQYTDAIQKQSEATAELNDAQKEYNNALSDYAKAVKDYMDNNNLDGLEKARKNLENTQEKLTESSKAAAEASVEVQGLDAVMSKLAEGTPESVQEALDMYAQIPVQADTAADSIVASQSVIKQALNSMDYAKATEGFRLAVMQIEESGGRIPESLRDTITAALSKFDHMGTEGKEKMTVAMGKMMEGMSEQIPAFEGAAQMTSEEIIESFQKYLKDSGALEGTGNEAMFSLAEGVEEGKSQAVTAAEGAAEETGNAVEQKLDEKKPEIAESAEETIGSGISDGANSADTTSVPTQKTKEAADSVKNTLEEGKEQIAQASAESAEQINSGYENADLTSVPASAGNESVQALINALTVLNESVQHASTAIGTSATMGLFAANMPGSFAGQGSSAVANLASSIAAGSGAGAKAASDAGAAAGSGIANSGIGAAFQGAGSNAGSLLGASISGSQASIAAATSSLGIASANALKGVNLSSGFQTQAKLAVTQFCNAIRLQTSTAINVSRALGTSVIRALTSCNLQSSAQTQGRLFGSSLSSGIKSQNSAVSSAASSIGNTAKSALNGYANSGYGIGVQFSAGLANGIRAGQYGVAAAAAAVANAAAQSAKANLQIHSPSRVGDYIGKMFDKGIETGTLRNVLGIERAVESVTDKMKINPAELLYSMRDAIESNIDRISARYHTENMPARSKYGETPEKTEVKQEVNIYQPVKSPIETAREIKRVGRELAFG